MKGSEHWTWRQPEEGGTRGRWAGGRQGGAWGRREQLGSRGLVRKGCSVGKEMLQYDQGEQVWQCGGCCDPCREVASASMSLLVPRGV